MGNLIIINGSPRAPKSNSKRYIELFTSYCKSEVNSFNITKNNHKELCEKISFFNDLLLVFPLYADGLPVPVLNFLKTLEETPIRNKPIIHVIINCGFIEPDQNMVCIEMVKLFCRQNNYTFGSALSIGSGEAILDTPFKLLVKWRMKKMVAAIEYSKPTYMSTTLPISKKLYIKASTNYWINYGKKYGVSREMMNTMEYE